jgi:hypothetical protein
VVDRPSPPAASDSRRSPLICSSSAGVDSRPKSSPST